MLQCDRLYRRVITYMKLHQSGMKRTVILCCVLPAAELSQCVEHSHVLGARSMLAVVSALIMQYLVVMAGPVSLLTLRPSTALHAVTHRLTLSMDGTFVSEGCSQP
jgi:hypothetical protein